MKIINFEEVVASFSFEEAIQVMKNVFLIMKVVKSAKILDWWKFYLTEKAKICLR